MGATTTGLLQRRVVNTRAPHQAARLDSLLLERGAVPLSYPCIDIAEPGDTAPLDAALQEALGGGFDWLLLTSENTALALARRLVALGRPQDALAHVDLRVGVVGPATAEAAEMCLSLRASCTPSRASAHDLVAALPDLEGARVLLPQSELAGPEAAESLRATGADVTAVPAYRTVPGSGGIDLAAELREGTVDAVILSSPSAVRNLLERLRGDSLDAHDLADVTVACIGTSTAAAAAEAGLTVAVCPKTQTLHDLVEDLDAYFSGGSMHASATSTDAIVGSVTSDPAAAAACWGPTGTPARRSRRLRRSAALREMVRETTLTRNDFIYPLFVHHEDGGPRPIAAMPGQMQWSLDTVADEARRAHELGLRAVLLFGIPSEKDCTGCENYDPEGVVPAAIRAIKAAVPDMLVVSDMCFCEYTDHGHCGVVNTPGSEHYRPELPEGYLLNDPTLELLGRASVVHAQAGADIIAPSGMIDGMVAAIRCSLDAAGLETTLIMSYAAKYASGYYGPFREAAGSAPQFGDRSQYQMDPANRREALKEVATDIAEGADIVMVKPALPYLDVISAVRQMTELPLAAYQVSGEYAMLKAAAERGWLDYRRCALEGLTSIKRAGADIIISYLAPEVAAWLD